MDNIFWTNLFVVVLAFCVSMLIAFRLIPSVNQIARAKGLLNLPDERTSHRYKTPNLGGISIFIAFCASSLFFIAPKEGEAFQLIYLASIIIFFTGLKDDIITIAPESKLLSQVIVAGLIVYAKLKFTHGFSIFGISQMEEITSIVVTIVFIVSIINALNLIDGIDGLAAAIGMVILGTFGLFFFINEMHNWTIFCASMVGALFAFFQYNVFGLRNKTFMGDSGSLLLGLGIGVVTIVFWETNGSEAGFPLVFNDAPAIAVSILIIPIFDTARIFFYRLIRRTSPFSPDRNHLHHRLIDLGIKHFQATLILTGLNILMITIAICLSWFCGHYLGSLWICSILIVLMLSFVGIINRLLKRKRLRESII